MDDFTISDLAQGIVLGLGALGSLLLVIWQSRCLCRCRIGISDQCYIFDCQREPPKEIDEEKAELTGADEIKDEEVIKNDNKKDEIIIPEPEPEPEPESIKTSA
tara:strand:- start:1677 stop:1988 length:312 start_codon:yes stop_codon:yes gene_type:complete